MVKKIIISLGVLVFFISCDPSTSATTCDYNDDGLALCIQSSIPTEDYDASSEQFDCESVMSLQFNGQYYKGIFAENHSCPAEAKIPGSCVFENKTTGVTSSIYFYTTYGADAASSQTFCEELEASTISDQINYTWKAE